MIGPFKPAPGNFKFVFVLIHKFSKWIEYMPLVKATSEKAVVGVFPRGVTPTSKLVFIFIYI
jgi:hypothetical protein